MRHLSADYRWLEEVSRADDVAKRSRPPAPKRELPSALSGLVYQARMRGVQLALMNPGQPERKDCSQWRLMHSSRFMPSQ